MKYFARMISFSVLTTVFLALFLNGNVVGQDAQITKTVSQPVQLAAASLKTTWEMYLVAGTILFGVVMSGIFCWLSTRPAMPDTVQRSFLVLTIVFASLFLIVAGYSDSQTAPVFGLLGTIAGYIFGRGVNEAAEPNPQENAGGKDPVTPGGQAQTQNRNLPL